MIHYVLASHGNYAREALNSAKMICGEDTDRMNLLSVQDDGDGIDRFGTEAAELAGNLRGEPVLIIRCCNMTGMICMNWRRTLPPSGRTSVFA